MKRPASVLLVVALVVLSAIFDLAFGIWMVLAPFGPDLTVTDLTGNAQAFPGFALVINGLLSVVLGLMYLWLAREAMIGSRTAYMLVNVLATINIVFGLLRLPYGWLVIGLSAIALLAANTTRAREWFSQQP